MSAPEFAPSASAFGALSTWLPEGLTEDQMDRVIRAASAMAAVVWDEATQAALARDRLRREARANESTTT